MMLTNLSGLALLVFVLLSAAVPVISALLTKAPSWVTGLLSLIQVTIIGLLAEWKVGGDDYNWQHGAEKALLAAALVIGSRKFLTEGKVENEAHARGVT